jgi:hypothetical protein
LPRAARTPGAQAPRAACRLAAKAQRRDSCLRRTLRRHALMRRALAGAAKVQAQALTRRAVASAHALCLARSERSWRLRRRAVRAARAAGRSRGFCASVATRSVAPCVALRPNRCADARCPVSSCRQGCTAAELAWRLALRRRQGGARRACRRCTRGGARRVLPARHSPARATAMARAAGKPDATSTWQRCG